MPSHPDSAGPAWSRTATRWDWALLAVTIAMATYTIWVESVPVVDSPDGLLLGLVWPVIGLVWAIRLFESVRRRRSRVAAGLLALGAFATFGGVLIFVVDILFGDVAVLLAFAAGTLVFGFVLWSERPRRLSWLMAPAVVVVTLIAIGTGIPAAVRFSIGSSDLSAYAQSYLGVPPATPPTPDQPVEVGSVRIYDVELYDGCVHLTTAYVGVLGDYPAGLAFCPSGAPANRLSYVQIQGEWFRWGPDLASPRPRD